MISISASEFTEMMRPKKRGRFPVSDPARRTADGRVFASIKEKDRYVSLRLKKVAGLICGLECQVPFKVEINGQHLCTWTADFRYRDTATGASIIEEVKGRGKGGTASDPYYKLRRKAAELTYHFTVTEVRM